jgi:glycosyltransferase involved in cell wall biosynthesis
VKLMRNDWVFCGAPPSTSTSCKVCVYGQERQSHQQEISKLLDLEKIKVIAPSSVADEIWSQANISNKECEVFPHAEIIENFGLEVDQVPNKRPKIAYIGYANRAKGWDSYLEYFQSNKDSEIDFYVFSRDNPRIEGITFVELLNTGRNPSECTNLLNQNGINYVFIWPEWPETFSYVTLEAIAAGCQVVTNKHSGNVRKLAEKYNVSLIPANLQECQSIILNHWSRNRQGQNFQNQYQVIHRNYLLEHLPNKLENSN